jgi:restriction system protein
MAIPDYQSIMLPLLRLAGDGREHHKPDVVEMLAVEFKLTDGEKAEGLPSGTQLKFDNRVGWAKTYLTKAGLLESTGRGRFKITARGQDILKAPPKQIDNRYLSSIPEFLDFRLSSKQVDAPTKGAEPDDSVTQTPEELLESSYSQLRRALALELLEKAKACSPRFFERLVVDLLVAMGYGGSRADAGQAVGRSGDDGIDGIIKEDKLGLDAVYIQAKRWHGAVGRPGVQAFAGSLEGHRARKGVLITTSHYSQDALDYVGRIEKKIVLIDGQRLAQLMIDHGVGVAEMRAFVLKRIDHDYFADE